MVGRGLLIEVAATIYTAITGTDSVITIKKNGTTTSQTITVTQSGSAAGSTFRTVLAPAISVDDGDVIEFNTDGASSTTSVTNCQCVVDEGRY